MKESAIVKALAVMEAVTSHIKTASDVDVALKSIDDSFIKIAQENNIEGYSYKVANLVADIIRETGLADYVDVEDFVVKTATAEAIYEKLADSNNLAEKDMAEIAKNHINSIFTKLAFLLFSRDEAQPVARSSQQPSMVAPYGDIRQEI